MTHSNFCCFSFDALEPRFPIPILFCFLSWAILVTQSLDYPAAPLFTEAHQHIADQLLIMSQNRVISIQGHAIVHLVVLADAEGRSRSSGRFS
jgi:hypothetical protein